MKVILYLFSVITFKPLIRTLHGMSALLQLTCHSTTTYNVGCDPFYCNMFHFIGTSLSSGERFFRHLLGLGCGTRPVALSETSPDHDEAFPLPSRKEIHVHEKAFALSATSYDRLL